MGAKRANALKAPAWTSAQATDCDLKSRSRVSVWSLPLPSLSLSLSLSLFSVFFLSSSLSLFLRLSVSLLSSHIIISISIFRGPQYGHVPGRQAHEVVWMLRRMVEQGTEWQIQIFVMDCDVAAAFDHVSHHEIKATLAMGVPPVLIAAWIREYRNSETQVKLDDVVTPGIRRTRSGDPCAADLFGAALDTPAAKFCDMCQPKNWELPVGRAYLGLLLFADHCWIIAMSPGELQMMARAWIELLKSSGLRIDWREAVWCSTAQDSLAANITVSDTVITRRT